MNRLTLIKGGLYNHAAKRDFLIKEMEELKKSFNGNSSTNYDETDLSNVPNELKYQVRAIESIKQSLIDEEIGEM